jgi:hypothetical protein
MILNESAIVAAHSPLIVNGNLGDAYRAGTFGCCRLIDKIAVAHDAMLHKGKDFRIEPVIVVELAVRCLNSCGAAGLLALSGYWSPAQHHLRDLVETTQLFELFRRDPSEAARWAEAFGITRYQKFGFNQVQAKLRGDPGQFDLDAFKGEFGNWSNRGSHPSMEGLAAHFASPTEKVVGPSASPDRFRAFTADLFTRMGRATLFFVAALDAAIPDAPTVEKKFRYDLAVVQGAWKLLNGITYDEMIAAWPDDGHRWPVDAR